MKQPPLNAILTALSERLSEPRMRMAFASGLVAFCTVYLGGSLRQAHGHHQRPHEPPDSSRHHSGRHVDRYEQEKRRRRYGGRDH